MAAKISNWLGTRSHCSHLSGVLVHTVPVAVRTDPGAVQTVSGGPLTVPGAVRTVSGGIRIVPGAWCRGNFGVSTIFVNPNLRLINPTLV